MSRNVMSWNTVETCSAALILIASALTGCASTYNQAPHLAFGRFGFETELKRTDVRILDRVEATSEKTSILLGLIQIVDGDKLRILGIPFFEEQHALLTRGVFFTTMFADDVQDRAYYKALQQAPDADVIIEKASTSTNRGIPLLWDHRTVTVRGKAVTLISG